LSKPLDHPQTYLVVGPSGTGKTTYLAYFFEKHHKRFNETNYWLTPPSIADKVQELMPDWIVVTSDLLDERFAGKRPLNSRIAVAGDEFDRLLSKYEHSSDLAKAFTAYVSVHRHKGVDLLLTDQTFDFLYGVRTRGQRLVFTGLSETLFYVLKQHLTGTLYDFLLQNKDTLVTLGYKNRETIKKHGYAKAVMTTGAGAKLITFKRPKWYSKDLSTIWRDVSAADLKRTILETDSFSEFFGESDEAQAMYLAYHLARAKFGANKVTKEKFAAAFAVASKIVLGKSKTLPDSGRGKFEMVLLTHSLYCSWCRNPGKLKEAKQILKELTNEAVNNEEKVDEELQEVAASLR